MCFFKTYKKDEIAPNLGNLFKGTKKFFGILKNDARTIDDIYVDNSPKNAKLIKGMLDANAQTPEKVLGEEDCNVSFQYKNSTIATAYEQANTEQAQAESSVKESLKALMDVAKHLPVVSTIISVSNVLLECRKAYKGVRKIQKKNIEKANLLKDFKQKEALAKQKAREESMVKAKEEAEQKAKEEAEQKAREEAEVKAQEEKIMKLKFERLEFQYQKVHKLGLETITQLHHSKEKIEGFTSAVTKADECQVELNDNHLNSGKFAISLL